MNKLIFSLYALALTCIVKAIDEDGYQGVYKEDPFDGRYYHGDGLDLDFFEESSRDNYGSTHDGDDRDNNGLFGIRSISAGQMSSLFKGDRFHDRASDKSSDRSAAELAASKIKENSFAAKNKKSGENYLKVQNHEQLKANHDKSIKTNFGLTLVDQKSHDENNSIASKKGSSINKGDRFKVDQGVKKASFNDKNLKAADDKGRRRSFAKDLQVEKKLNARKENMFDDFKHYEGF